MKFKDATAALLRGRRRRAAGPTVHNCVLCITLQSRPRAWQHSHFQARATGTSSHRVVYCGVRLSCFIPQPLPLLVPPVAPECTVPLP